VARKQGSVDRFLTTVVMTDIVGSTEHAADAAITCQVLPPGWPAYQPYWAATSCLLASATTNST
jgi:hypothetical protein